MSEKTEITFMQTRLIRLASEEWHLPVEQIIHLFKEADVLGYIEKCYGIFHCEGDEAVLEDITEFLEGKGIEIRACLKNHSRNLYAPLCGIFCPNSVAVARYGALIRTKSPTNCDAHLAESLFQTRSSALLYGQPTEQKWRNAYFHYALSGTAG